MSDENPSLATVEQLREFLQVAQKLATPVKEQTLFSLGGRGYYENPASDLLAFFLMPSAEHGFGPLFLKIFLECMGVDVHHRRLEGVTVDREVATSQGNRIDLLVKGPDWVLLIENKVYHIQNNPFEDYEAHTQIIRGCVQRHFAILSPEGQSDAPAKWKPVSYKQYCAALRKAFAQAVFDFPYSKWLIFAREFIIHFENELYNPMMTPEQLSLVERHLPEVEQIKKMSTDYKQFLLLELKNRLNDEVPGHQFETSEENWALRCKDGSCEHWEFTLQLPASLLNPSRKFQVRVYIGNLTTEQGQQAAQLLSPKMKHTSDEDGWEHWDILNGFEERTEALDELCQIARQLACLWQG
jgi:hypothetical protein